MHLVVLALLVVSSVNAVIDEGANEVTASLPLPGDNLDGNLRRALLKALTELENDENDKTTSISSTTDDNSFNTKYYDVSERSIEKAKASAFSVYTNIPTTTEVPVSTTGIEATTQEKKSIVVIQKSDGVEHTPQPKNSDDHILTSATNSFRVPTSVSQKKFFNGATSNSLQSVEKTTPPVVLFIKPRDDQSKFSATSSIANDTSNSLEENQPSVEDVQFFSAPLVAAFTVHQDEAGRPKSVIPIFKGQIRVSNVKTNSNNDPKSKHQINVNHLNHLTANVEYLKHQNQPDPVKVSDEQVRIQKDFQSKQRLLEEEIARLKQQQYHQQYLLRQQQVLHQHQLKLQEQKFQEQILRSQTTKSPQFVPAVTTNTIRSISDVNIGALPLNGQQLPVKDAVEFRPGLVRQPVPYRPFNFVLPSTRVPSSTQSLIQQLPLNTFNQPQFLQSVPDVQQNIVPPNPSNHNKNRVFRQESNVGNFGINNAFQSNFDQNRFFRPSVNNLQNTNNFQSTPIVNHQQLNNLLYKSGIIKNRQLEDFNIISKVIAFNHPGGDFNFAASNIHEQLVPPPLRPQG